ncbi:MAG: restriction endonuclease [Alphaproteobacteria bacterium]|jgi:predicted helicase|nr:restriction endonuclease [Alphaproteobacteria bacterium]
MLNFNDILEKYRKEKISNSNMGTKFEKLMQQFLKINSLYYHEIAEVYLWNDFPYKKEFGTGKDIGIDIVVETYTKEYWAVQCKFYATDTQIKKADVDSFLATSNITFNNTNFSKKLWISTTNNWNTEAGHILSKSQVERIGLNQLQNSNINWEELYKFSEISNIDMNLKLASSPVITLLSLGGGTLII